MAKDKAPARTKLSRSDMEDVIKRGGSVMHDGEIITKISDLPDEVDLAETPEEIAAAEAKVDAEEKAVADKKAKVASKASAKKSAKK